MQTYFKCLNQLVMVGFFFLFFVRGLILKTKPQQDVMPRAIDFFKLVLYQLFHFRQESYDNFFNKNCFAYFSYFAP